jgi:hypothetical protein
MQDAGINAATEIDWSAYEAIVGKRAGYYLPRFRRFAEGGRISWSWSAFFGTFAWLRYRKLYAWSWPYFLFTLLMLLWSFNLVGGDACRDALDPGPRDMARWILGSLLGLGYVVPALFANRIYFNRVRKLLSTASRERSNGHIQRETASDGGGWAIGVALALQFFFFMGVAIAVPSYADYTYRLRVSEGISLTAASRNFIDEYVKDHHRLPPRIEDLAGRYVSKVEMAADGTVTAYYGEKNGLLSGHSLRMTPRWEKNNIADWVCSSDLPKQCLPLSCRVQ